MELACIKRTFVTAGRSPARRVALRAAAAVLAGAAAVALTACGGGSAGDSEAVMAATRSAILVPGAPIDRVSVIGKIDADSGAPGTFTGEDGWPAVAPSDIHVSAGATVILTIREYDDMVTPLPPQSAFNSVMGGTEKVDGKQVSRVSNQKIAHTITIPTLGINIPLPKAPEGGFTTVQFTFRAPAAGTYQWLCVTPCGIGPYGIDGAMHDNGWMRGHLVVS